MRNHISSLKGLTIVIALTALAVATASADDMVLKAKGQHLAPFQHGNGFNVSGRFSGALIGDIDVNGMTYHLTPNTAVYELGRGSLELGETVTDRFIFLAGSRKDGADTIYSVIIRPITDSTGPMIAPTESNGSEPR